MSEQVEAPKASELNKNPEQVFVINVNGKELPVYRFLYEKGRFVNEPFLSPKLDELGIENISSIIPTDVINENLFRPALKKFILGVYSEAKARATKKSNNGEDSQVFDQVLKDEFTSMFLKVSSASESLRALKAQRDELLAELPSVDAAKDPQKFQALVLKIQDICKDIEEKTAPDEAEEETQKKAA